MDYGKAIDSQFELPLRRTELDFLSGRYEGKVRDAYRGRKYRYLITTDRISCFDVVLGAVPFKGQVLNQMADYWFRKTEGIIENHLVACPDPNVMVVHHVDILPVEVVVRGYLAGSAWRDYQEGRAVSGIRLPNGLACYEKLSEPLITPSTKAPKGEHDEPISEIEIIQRGIVSEKVWEEVRTRALELFHYATHEVAKRGLLLVDTKYEFGLRDGRVVLADEVHTLDSSRYWVSATYESALSSNTSPEMLDKEPVRQWLIAQGFMGVGTPPHLPDEYVRELSLHYISAFERITGESFVPSVGDTEERIKAVLEEYELRDE